MTKLILSLLELFAQRAQAAWAEFGSQHIWPGLSAAADLSAKQYVVMRFAAATTVNIASEVLVTGALKGPIGILQNAPKSGEPATVAYMGLSKAFGGGTVTAGAPVSYNSSGCVIDAVSGDTVIGRAMETATTHAEIVTVMLFPPVKWASVA